MLELRQEVHGPKHPETIKAMAHLTISSVHLGRYEEAAYFGRQVLKLRIETFGRLHLDTLEATENLAASLYDQKEAERLYREVSSIKRKVLGDRHADAIVALGNLAYVLRNLEQNEESEDMQYEVVKLDEIL